MLVCERHPPPNRNTRQWCFLVAEISSFLAVHGPYCRSVIAIGTPSRCGYWVSKPPIYLQTGDVVELCIERILGGFNVQNVFKYNGFKAALTLYAVNPGHRDRAAIGSSAAVGPFSALAQTGDMNINGWP